MSEQPEDEWTKGDLLGRTRALPPVILDCSGWESDIPAEQWSTGDLIGVTRSLPPTAAPAGWLELVVSFDADTGPAKAFEQTNQLIAAVTSAVPELGLRYDFHRTRTENGDVVVALTPGNPAGAADRLARAAEVVRQAAAQIPARRPITVRVGGTAA